MIKRIAAALLLLFAATASAEDAKAKAAREELERQLHQMVGKQPTKVRVDFVGLDDPNYKIEEAVFDLDGRRLPAPSLSQLSEDGTHLIWNGDVTPGKHTVKVLLVFFNGASVVLSDEGGYKWRVGGDVTFEVNSGIEVRVQVTPRRDDKQTDVSKRFKLALPAQPVMIAKLDDGSMPEAPKPVVIEVADAGPAPEQLAEATKQQEALAAEAKKKQAEEAAEAKRAAAEAKKQKAAEALEAKRAAAAAKKEKAAAAALAKKEKAAAAALARKEKAAAALEAKRAAAEEKKRLAQEKADEKKRLAQAAIDAKNPPPVVETPDAGLAVAAAEPIDAGLPEEDDAGAPVEVAVVDAGVSTPVAAAPVAEAEEDGPPWLVIGLAGSVAALIFLIVVARRRARPPSLDD